MDPLDSELKAPKTLRDHIAKALVVLATRKRPVSFYLMFAILVVVLLGSQVVYIKEDPKKLAFFLALNFVFFLVVVYRAIVDFFEITRNHFQENEKLFRTTLGDEEFTAKLGTRVSENRDR